MSMEVTIVGCGEAFDDAFPNTSIHVNGPLSMLLDCGYSVPPRLWSSGIAANELDVIYLSHAHADHYFGMPALLGRMWEEGRTKPLTILAQTSVLDQLKDVLDYGYRTLSRRFAFEIAYRPAEPCEIGGATFSFAPTTHAVTNFAIRIESGGRSVFYSGDGAITDSSRRLMTGAGLAIHEAYSFDELPIHADIPSVLAAAADRHVEHTALVHVARKVRRDARSRIDDALHAANASMPVPGDRWIL